MPVWGGLTEGLQNFQQGQNNAQQFQQRAQQIQQGQMALDAAKKQLAAQAAVFNGMGGGQGGQGGGMPSALPGQQMPPPPAPQPPMPGQSSMPAQPPQGGAPAAGQPPGGMPVPQPQGGAPAAPQQPMQPQGGGQQQIDPTDPRAAVQTVMSLAREIKSRNPGIDPQTLFQAVSQTIDMSKGLAPALRQGAQVVIQQMKDQTSSGNTDKRVGATERGQDMQQENVGTRTASNEKIASGHDAASLQRVQEQGQQAMARTQANITSADQRAKDGTWSREKTAAYKERAQAAGLNLKTATQRITSLTNAGVKPDDPRQAAAAKDAAAATAELDRVNKVSGLSAGGDAPADNGAPLQNSHAPAPAPKGPAPAMLKGKPIWPEGGKWVYEDGSEAK